MKRGIGKTITKLREEAGFTQKQLCEGICSVTKLAKMESDRLVPGYFQLDRLFARMGKSTERLEYVLPKEVYELYELQYLIQDHISRRKLEKAEELLHCYEQKKWSASAIHRQYIDQERAQIAWIREERAETVLVYLNAAIERTMYPEGMLKKGNAVSAEELKLLLFRWEVSRGTAWERPLSELSEIFGYIEHHGFDSEEKVRVYPYAVLLMTEEMDMEKEYDAICYLYRTALELLREEGRLLYMTEILEGYAKVLAYGEKETEYVKELSNWHDSLIALEEEYGVHLEKYRLFHHLNRSFELDYEVIRHDRKAMGISQEVLAEEICAPESLSRIESGRRSPSNRNLELLLKKLKRERERVNPVITTEQYEILMLEREFVKAMHNFEYETAKKVLDEMETKPELKSKENMQYSRFQKVIKDSIDKNIGYEECIKRLYDILKSSIEEESDIFKYRLTFIESSILNQIACQYERNQQKEKGIGIWKKIIENYEKSEVLPVFRIREWQLAVSNMAGAMEELNIFAETLELCNKVIRREMSVGKGNGIGRSVAIMACVLERKHDNKCIPRFRQTLDIMKLMKMEYRYNCIKEYVEQKEIGKFI